MKIATTIALFCMMPLTALYAQTAPEPLSDQMEEILKTDPFSVGILLQSTANFSLEDDNFNGGRRFGLGATRLSFGGTVDQNYTYKLQLDFRNTPSVMDANVGYIFSDEFQLRAGMQKPFLSADLDPNPGDTEFISRARLVGAMLNTREVGVTGLGNAGDVNYRFGIYNGTGRSVVNDNNFFYTARVGFAPELNEGELNIGVNLGYNRTEFEPVGNTGQVSSGDRAIYGAFAKYDSEKIFGTLEVLRSEFERANDGLDETITGFYLTVGSHITEKSDLLVRLDHLSFDVVDSSSELLVFGWNYQATRLISFQVNGLARIGDDNLDNQYGLAGNFQFQF